MSYHISQVKNYDHDRYVCCLFANELDRDKLFSIFAFNIEIALISEQTSDLTPALMRITWWQDAIDDLYQGKIRPHSLINDLNKLIVKYKIPKKLFDDLLNARMIELYQDPPLNMEELKLFSERTGANLLEIAARCLDLANPEKFRPLGSAWSLLGMLRSVKYVTQTRKFIPFPKDLLPQNFKLGDSDNKLIVKQVVREIELLLTQVDQALFTKSSASLDLLFFLSRYYIKLLKKNDYDVFTSQLLINPVLKQLYLLYKYVTIIV
jgi:phytoene/squalene synthetase